MHRYRFLGLAILSIQLGALGLPAQTDRCARRTVPVSVSGSDRVLAELTAETFQATIRHLPIKILSVTPNQGPVRVFLLLDASGSMATNARTWQAYIDVAEKVLDELPASIPVGLMVFSDRVEATGLLGTNRAVIRQEFERLRSRHRVVPTALWDTLRAAALQFDPPQPGDTIYAITDGDDDASRTSQNTIEEILVGRGVRLFMFSIESKDGMTRKQWEKSTNRLIKATGGTRSVFLKAEPDHSHNLAKLQ
jgi:von Willebrand factor type A domain